MPRLSVAALVAVTMVALGSTSVVAGPDLAEDLQETEQQLEDARRRLDQTEQQVGTAESELEAVDRQLVTLTDELRRRERELARAREQLAGARQRTNAAIRRLRETTRELEATRTRLAERRDLLRDRAADVYKHGGNLGLTEAVLGAEDPGELARQLYFLSVVMETDQQVIDAVTEDVARISRLQARADRLRDERAAEAQRVAEARDRIEAATREQRRLVREVGQEQDRREGLLRRLRDDRAAHAELVADLEAESERLAEELAASRWQPGTPGAGTFVWPTEGRVTSGYGMRRDPIFGTPRMHQGIDISGRLGQPVMAAAPGQVYSAGWRGGYGLATVVDHGGGVFTLYAHQSRLGAAPGDVVDAGQKIGEVGSTGHSTGPHLHFEVRVDGAPQDPMEWYRGDGG